MRFSILTFVTLITAATAANSKQVPFPSEIPTN